LRLHWVAIAVLTVLVALSLDRAVLVPRTASTEALAAEVGPGWVQLFEGELSPEDLVTALARLADAPLSGRPDLTDRDWSNVGRRHAQAYRLAVASTRKPPTRSR